MITRILLIEDHVANRVLVTNLLQDAGYQVIQAADGEEGLRLAREEHPDLMIIDLLLPKLDGWEVMRQLRLEKDYQRVPVIALTANALPETAAQAARAGFDEYLTKPTDIFQILSVVNQYQPAE